MKYQKEINQTSVLLHFDPDLFFTNSKIEIPKYISEQQADKLYEEAYEKSDFLHFLDDEYFLENFQKTVVGSFSQNNIKLYSGDSITDFIKQPYPSMILDMKQIEIEEYYGLEYVSPEDEFFGEDVEIDDFYAEIPVNALAVNMWFEATIFYSDSIQTTELIFLDYIIKDEPIVDFYPIYAFDKIYDFEYSYKLDSLNGSDIWELEKIAPQEFVLQSINYMVNKLVENKLKPISFKEKKFHWHYSPKSGKVLPTSEVPQYTILKRDISI